MRVVIERVTHGNVAIKCKDKDKLFSCISLSAHCWKGTIDGDVVCIWGLIPPTLLSYQAYLWLVTTEEAHYHTFIFVRGSQIIMQQMLELYERIVGHCDLRERNARKWLRWLGAEFEEGNGPLIPFRITRNGSSSSGT